MSRYFSVIFLSLHLAAMGQSGLPEEGISLAERRFLDLILRDTISSTICRLPTGMNFGIQNPDTGRLVLVKERKINQILLEGTNRVYEPDPTRKTGLMRKDATFYTGDNFNFIAFRRRDTLFQYGGYGFFDTRDFFTWYRAWSHDWEIEFQTDYLQQQWTAYQYDPETDALFTMGRRFRGPFDDADQYTDSVYRFDFRSKNWAAIGRINKHLPWSKRPVQTSDLIAHTPFGLLLRSGEVYILADIKQNLLYKPTEELTGRLMTVTHSDKIKLNKHDLFIHLQDTLFVINTEPGADRFTSIPLHRQDFKPEHDHPQIFITGSTSTKWIQILTGGLALLLFALLIRSWRMKKPTKVVESGSTCSSYDTKQDIKLDEVRSDPGTSEQEIHAISTRDQFGNDLLKEFLSHLNEVERALITNIVKTTIEDQKMDIQRINEIIGVNQKPMAIQKARRSLVIHQINRTFALTTGSKTELIRKERDLFEKRTYIYSADPEAALALNRLM